MGAPHVGSQLHCAAVQPPPAVWTSRTESAQAFLREYDTDDRKTNLSLVSPSSMYLHAPGDAPVPYTVSAAQRHDLFREIVPSQLALPPPGRPPVDILHLLRWPYSVLFSDEVMATVRRTPVLKNFELYLRRA